MFCCDTILRETCRLLLSADSWLAAINFRSVIRNWNTVHKNYLIIVIMHPISKDLPMSKLFSISDSGIFLIFFSALGIYLSVIVLTRICGKRSFSKMSSFDFAMTVAVGSIIATTVLSSSVSLLEGIIGLASIYLLQIVAAYSRRNKVIRNAMDNTPLLLMDGQNILFDNLRKARVAEGDLRAKLREANIVKLSQVKAVIFETTGNISVLHSEDYLTPDAWLLQDVQRK